MAVSDTEEEALLTATSFWITRKVNPFQTNFLKKSPKLPLILENLKTAKTFLTKSQIIDRLDKSPIVVNSYTERQSVAYFMLGNPSKFSSAVREQFAEITSAQFNGDFHGFFRHHQSKENHSPTPPLQLGNSDNELLSCKLMDEVQSCMPLIQKELKAWRGREKKDTGRTLQRLEETIARFNEARDSRSILAMRSMPDLLKESTMLLSIFQQSRTASKILSLISSSLEVDFIAKQSK